MTHDDRRFDHHRHNVLTNAERLAHWNPPQFLKRLSLRPGDSVLDLGCGPGFWTLPLAEIVGESGKIWALDVSQEMLDALAKNNPPSQVYPLLNELPEIKLPDTSIDFVWAAFVFHEVMPPETAATEIRRVLKEGGVLAVLDWSPDATGESGPPLHHRISIEQVSKYLRNAGFKSVSMTWRDADTYLIEAK